MPESTSTTTEAQQYARNARIVAAVLDALPPEVETPKHIGVTYRAEIEWLIFSEKETDQKARTAAIVRAIGGKWDKRETGDIFRFERDLNGVHLLVAVDREQVCTRVVTGTHEVTKLVPAPDAPMVEVVETVEDVTWECAPLLAEAVS